MFVLSTFAGLKCSFFTTQPALCVDIPRRISTEAKGSRMSSSVPALQEASGGPEVFQRVLAAKLNTATAEALPNTTTSQQNNLQIFS